MWMLFIAYLNLWFFPVVFFKAQTLCRNTLRQHMGLLVSQNNAEPWRIEIGSTDGYCKKFMSGITDLKGKF